MCKSHPYAELFPMYREEDREELAGDIRLYGLRDPILVDDTGRVIDGRNRLAACESAGVEPRFETFDGDDAAILALVVSKNLRRRHLDESQRAAIAARIANLQHGSRADLASNQDRPIGRSSGKSPPVTQSDAAKLMNVSERSVRRAKRVIEKATPEIQEAVTSGKMSVTAAEEASRLPAQVQQEIAASPAPASELTKKRKGKAKPRGPRKTAKRGIAMDRAAEALNILRGIPRNDPLLPQAIRLIRQWTETATFDMEE